MIIPYIQNKPLQVPVYSHTSMLNEIEMYCNSLKTLNIFKEVFKIKDCYPLGGCYINLVGHDQYVLMN